MADGLTLRKRRDKMQNQNDRRGYEELMVRKDVMVRVPRKGDYMIKVDAHEFELHRKMVPVDSHWKNGFLIPSSGLLPSACNETKGVILNRLFYGIEDEDLGKKVVARVEVVQKTTRDGRKYLMLNIYKASNGARATSYLKFPTDGTGDISILGTKTKILFDIRRPVKKR